MSLRIIYGRAGSGKSKFCIDNIKDRWSERPENPLILIVPEQFSFQAEKSLVEALGGSGIGSPEVLSFKRLARRVLDEVGGGAKQHINNAGKAMIIHNVLGKNRDDFKAFGRSAGQKGFVNKLSGMLSEFKRYNITPFILGETTDKIEDRFLKDKLEDLTLIYSNYEKILHERYIDTDDDLTLLKNRISESDYLKGAEIWIDEFSGFTPQEYEIISKLLQIGKRISVTLCTDCLSDTEQIQDIDVFSSTKYTANKLIEISKDINIKIEKPLALKPPIPWRFSTSKALHHMEKFLFQYPYKTYKEKTDSLKIASAANLFDEVESIAINIVNYAREKKIRYKDMAVIARNLDDYEKLIRIIFPQYNIAFFIDKKREVTDHPLVLLVLSSLQILMKNFSYESVFRYLKTGLLFESTQKSKCKTQDIAIGDGNIDSIGENAKAKSQDGANERQDLELSIQDIDMLENYVLANGIRGSKWYQKEAWDYRIEYSIEEKELEKDELEMIQRINDIRLSLVQPLITFKDKIKTSKKAKDLCQYLYEFLCDIKIPEKIEKMEAKYKEENLLEIAQEYRQIWDIIINILDQIVEISGDEKLKLEDFHNMLELGFSECNMGIIPHAVDEILIGSIDRWRSHEIDVLFILGANDGVLPAISKDEGMLTDKDRGLLKELGLELAPDTRTQAFDEQFLLYSSLTKTGGILSISYPLADSEGKGLRPSTIISKLKRIFPNMERIDTSLYKKDSIVNIVAILPAFNLLISSLRNLVEGEGAAEDIWKDLYLYFLEKPQWQSKLEFIVDALFYKNEEEALRYGIAGKKLYTSVSRLEKYMSCPFSYFVQYGLRAKERRIMKMEAPDIGSFLHLVISKFSEDVEKENLKWAEIDNEWMNKKIDEHVNDIVEHASGLPLKRSKRYIYLKNRLKKIVKRSIWLIIEHAKRSGFQPIMYEAIFGEGGLPTMTFTLPDGEEVVLTGIIDRIDILKTQDKDYIRIIDYKSGNKDFRLSDIYYGLQLQLILYLSTIWEKGIKGVAEDIEPAGVFYFKLDEPLIRTKGKEENKDIEKEIMKELKMKGLILADTNIIKEMDNTIDGYSMIIPAMMRKDGSLGKNSSVATIEQFEILKSHAKDLLYSISKEINKGNIDISPYKKGDYTSCKYCPYTSICRFEGNLSGNKYKILKDINNEKVWELLGEDAKTMGGEILD